MNMNIRNLLNTPIKYITEPWIANIINIKFNISKYIDLIFIYPKKYENNFLYKISDLYTYTIHQYIKNIKIKILGIIISKKIIQKNNKKILIAIFKDKKNTGTIDLIWFKNINFFDKNIQINIPIIIYGNINFFINKIQIIHPEIKFFKKNIQNNNYIYPIYITNNKKNKLFIINSIMTNLIKQLIQKIKYINIKDNIPNYIINKYNLINKKESLIQIHFPSSIENLFQAKNRILFEYFFYMKINILLKKNSNKYNNNYNFTKIGKYFTLFYKKYLPFKLTNAQKKVIKDIRNDLGKSKQMNRLIQGDVGCGKTIIALMSMLIALDNGYQSCFMAPTEVLAYQHYYFLIKMLNPMGININIITGSIKQIQYKNICQNLKLGNISILVGTHSLIEEKIIFKKLGLVVIDEQHKFGVAQRAKLWKKNIQPPHILIMTATPIPRTLNMALYNNIDLSIIDELPNGRKLIKTIHCYEENRNKLFLFFKNELKKGNQIFIIYPRIYQNNKKDYNNLLQGYKYIHNIFNPLGYNISILHSKMTTEEKKIQIKNFIKKKNHIMVSTTVIEVGINIPNASIILIENADNFGLSQLHQLRGRVGRGNIQGYCFLMTQKNISNEVKKKMEIMCSTHNGWDIAIQDLKLRGPGNLIGTKQSGIKKIITFNNNIKNILKQSYKEAIDFFKKNPNIKNNYIIKKNVKYYNNKNFWEKIS